MARTIPQRELQNANARVIDAVAAGETFIVTRRGVPVAELRPVGPLRRSFIPKNELRVLARTGSHTDAKQFRDDLDRVVDQGL